MDDQPLPAHSAQEAFLYVLITPCDVCEQMCVRPDPPQLHSESANRAVAGDCVVTGLCDNCQSAHRHRFRFTGGGAGGAAVDPGNPPGGLIESPKGTGPPNISVSDPLARNTPINPTGERSAIIDVVQWVNLYAYFVEAATRTPDRVESRWNLIRAGECLDEALRFFDGGEQPSDGAVLTPLTRRVLAAHPERYARSCLLELRRRCPLRT